jgi:hypothetical protein
LFVAVALPRTSDGAEKQEFTEAESKAMYAPEHKNWIDGSGFAFKVTVRLTHIELT